jgi:hypothetical protein
MNSQFKRMQFLAGIIKENTLYEEPEPDFSALAQIDNIVGDELEDAQKQQPVDEILGLTALTAAAFALAIPGIINGVFRIIKAIKDKAPSRFNLSKPGDNQSHIDYIIAFTDKMDGILDTPFRIMLTPFIKDSIKRDKVAKFIKAIALLIMALGTDISKSPTIMNVGEELIGDVFNQVSKSKTLEDLIKNAKTIIPKLLT